MMNVFRKEQFRLYTIDEKTRSDRTRASVHQDESICTPISAGSETRRHAGLGYFGENVHGVCT